MALLNTGCSVSTIQADITGLTTGYAAECFAILAAGVDGATSDRCVTIPNSGSLPSLYPTQTIPEGQIVFVDDIGVSITAASGKWVGLDGRVFRYDYPVSTLWAWGYNAHGRIGNGTTTSCSVPSSVAGNGINWKLVCASASNTASIKNDGTLWVWGLNNVGQLGDGTTTSRISPVAVAGGGVTWCAVSVGACHMMALKTDGTLWTWGLNSCGQLGDGTTTNRSSPGTVAGGGNTWRDISAGEGSSFAVKTDGTLWTWGCNGVGDLGIGTSGVGTGRSSPGTTIGGGTNWSKVSKTRMSALALKTDGTLWTWGFNFYGELGDGTTTNRSSPGTVAGGGLTWCQIATGINHSMAIKTDNTLWTWGRNTHGRLGDGTTTCRSSPGTVAGGGTTWSKVSGFGYSTVALKTDGSLWTWGYNARGGQLGDGTTTNRSSPGTIFGGGNAWCDVSGGFFHTAAIKTSI